MNRTILELAVAAGGFLFCASVYPQYPQKPIRIIPNSAAATGPDIIARLFAAKVADSLGQPVVVENRPGSNGNIAGDIVAKSTPDGHTLFLGTDAQIAINPHVYSKMSWNPVKDVVPVASICKQAFELVVRPTVPAKTVAEFIAHAKSVNSPLFYGSAGNGSQHHLAMELFKQRTGINLSHIPYAGGGAATATALLAGDISATIGGSAVSVQVKAGKLRSLATTSATRLTESPDLPTIAETLPGYEILTWVGLFAPTGTPTDALNRLRSETSRFLTQKDVIEKLNAAGGFQIWNIGIDEFSTQIRRDYERYGQIVKTVGVRVD
ncbi:MAG: Bug family tripartite tricarboxylate transporter substrate binding protein [Burkholderiales bacterium]